jgi:hypothetical protein
VISYESIATKNRSCAIKNQKYIAIILVPQTLTTDAMKL